jgi:hypothetical protein
MNGYDLSWRCVVTLGCPDLSLSHTELMALKRLKTPEIVLGATPNVPVQRSYRNVSYQTIRNRLHSRQLGQRCPVVCIPLTRHHRRLGLDWCRHHLPWTAHIKLGSSVKCYSCPYHQTSTKMIMLPDGGIIISLPRTIANNDSNIIKPYIESWFVRKIILVEVWWYGQE